ncbi:MAG: tyrosine-type recombinase/integrase [Sphaerochaetaceae bacterium]
MKYRITQRKGRCAQVDFGDGWVSSGKYTKEEAIEWAEKQIKKNRKTDWNPSIDGVMFCDYARNFYTDGSYMSFRSRNERRDDPRSDSYYHTEATLFSKHVYPRWKHERLEDITPARIELWFTQIKGSKGELSGNYKNKILACLSNVMEMACVDGLIPENPCSKVKGMYESSAKREAFTKEEMSKMFPESDKMLDFIWGGRMWSIYFLIMRDTGWRPGEVAGLMRRNYYPDLNGIYTEHSVNTFEKRIVDRIKTSGDGFRYKVGILSDRTCVLLNKYLKTLDGDLLFSEKKNHVVTTSTSNKRFKEGAEIAQVDINGRPQYSLRTSFMTYMAGEVDNMKLMELMGHKQWRMCYDRRTPEMVIRQASSAFKAERG